VKKPEEVLSSRYLLQISSGFFICIKVKDYR
jgi:hypothetical protein